VNKCSVEHIPVLCNELFGQISLPQDAVVVDATVGHGGHSFLFGKNLGPKGIIFGLDVDEKCIQRAQTRLSDLACKVILVRANFAHLAEELEKQAIKKVDLILADLGFCSAQLADVERGLSFQEEMPLDMRLDDRLTITAADIVNRADEKTLADLIYRFGQDRASRRIARFLVQRRQAGQIHPATRTFQALRIAVNSELDNLKELLVAAPGFLRTGGYMAVIAFHSLEDGLVKEDFRRNAGEGVYEILTRKPITASREEIAENARARSAKLRIARRK